jgi:hypothetical protein
MEERKDQEAPKMSSVENEHEEFELNHTDKLVGVFSEPTATFSKMSKFPPKTSDWIIPVLVFIVVLILSQIVMMTNPAIKRDMIDKAVTKMEKQFNDAVKKGQLTQTQADEQMERMRDGMEQGGTMRIIGTIIGIPIVTFIVFFIMAGIYLLLAKFALKGEGTYKEAMVACGLPSYISAIQWIVLVIAAFITNKYLSGTSIADFIDSDKSTIAGFVFGKLDIFSIWFYAILGIGLAKMFKSNNTKKYIIAIFSLWIGLALLFFALTKAVPWLSFLAG